MRNNCADIAGRRETSEDDNDLLYLRQFCRAYAARDREGRVEIINDFALIPSIGEFIEYRD